MKNILDAGPLIAALISADRFHNWACGILERLGPPFYTCPEAIAEAAAMTRRPSEIVDMIRAKEIVIDFHFQEHTDAVFRLLNKYSDQRMDLADACIVRMTELNRDCRVITVDRDFHVYRRNGRDRIPLISPAV